MGLLDLSLVVRRRTSQIYVLDAALFSGAWPSGFGNSLKWRLGAAAKTTRDKGLSGYNGDAEVSEPWASNTSRKLRAGLTHLAYALPDSETSSCDLTALDALTAPSQTRRVTPV